MQIDKISELGSTLAANGLIPFDKLEEIITNAKKDKIAFVTYLVENNLLTSQNLVKFCEEKYEISILQASRFQLDAIPKTYLNKQLIEKHNALPVYIQNNTLYIAISDPTNLTAIEEFGFNFSINTEALLCEEEFLSKTIDLIFPEKLTSLENMEYFEEIGVNKICEPLDDQQNTKRDAPIVKYINDILIDAVNKGGSDLHFEPYEKKYRIRVRIDGILHEIATPPFHLANKFAARLKVMSNLNIAERRVPQDGRAKVKITNDRNIDLRVSTLPTMWGEKIVMRILDPSSANLDINKLGFSSFQKEKYLKALQQSQGMILITGPTGSGKTISLYTGLSILNTCERNISTAEDPIEINLEGINQVQINLKSGLTFGAALRAFLRQDPDIVMLGEIRDLETAEISIKAAQTGHLVLSTLHTNSAAETLTRLLNMGVPAYNIASSISLIIAQRLARRLCDNCKIPDNLDEVNLSDLGFNKQEILESSKIFKAVGCEKCTNGYKGRIGIYEVLEIGEKIRNIILSKGNALDIIKIAKEEGMDPLRQSAIKQALNGHISLSEILRVTLTETK